MNANWANKLYIGTAYTPGSGSSAGTWTYKQLCAGIEGMEFNINEQNQQFFFLCGGMAAPHADRMLFASGDAECMGGRHKALVIPRSGRAGPGVCGTAHEADSISVHRLC